MQRRSFFKLASALFLSLIRAPQRPAAQTQGSELLYTDSDNNTITTELSDRNLATGISYGA